MDYDRRNIPLYAIAGALFGLKTYLVYRFLFNISIENMLQEIILFINPFASAFFVFAISVLFKNKKTQMGFIRYSALVGTVILYFNLIFYRNFTDFITIPVLFQGSNAADLGSSILALIYVTDLFIFLDVAIIWYLSKRGVGAIVPENKKRVRKRALITVISLLILNLGLAEIERPQLLQRAFDREYLVKNIGVFNFHIYDIVLQSKTKTQRVFANGEEVPEIEEYVQENQPKKENSKLFGVAEGKNVILISLESFQSFVINNKVNGKEVTPFLNDFLEDSYYFDNFYHQTEQGKTSDHEFMIDNSLYPLPRGAVYFTHGNNEYNALPNLLGEKDYYSTVFHANNKSFWNRDVMYDNTGYDKYFDEESYDISDENSVGWGMKDKDFFEQSMEHLESLPQPFYSRFITLTNHYPFDLDEEDASIDRFDSSSNTLNKYFQTVRYTDEALEQFIQQLKQSGIYEDSILIIMGDHYGISNFHNKAMSQYLDKETINDYDHVQLQRVPLLIHIPGHEGETISEVAGQIDVKPTLLNLLGIEIEKDIAFGTDLFSEEARKDFIALRDGSFISEKYIYTKDQCYERATGELIAKEGSGILGTSDQGENKCKPIKEQVENELNYSDKIVYGDLLRFYDFDS
ncbi:LTA synthase family protein [Aquibacillus koreensis]|uniref:LTA synthase family protein n=1 Tax=Aquibacillus koreensis TaxID=279446 RepID=A0A9X3WMC9_9BACI|nr:LTA synthase family protein [Aquibacillus koreensis]MCT2538210.1 LTA synthase family protein [Aquibacillus koreensis]MDC3420846.1 LTA synthase family protein [Aquibacillus koreensis]